MEKCAVIMAGGKGTRLYPYTMVLPKPLVPISDYPIMEIVIKQLAYYGFKRIIITVNHQAELIETYFGYGSRYGVSIEYSIEKKALSTMGPLKLIKALPDNFLVMNSDVLTDLNYSDFFNKHIELGSLFSVSAFTRIQNVEYGVLLENEGVLSDFQEKPHIEYLVSMGIYAVSKEILKYIPENTFWGFDDLMRDLLNRQKRVNVLRHEGYWLDIGRPDDYKAATDEFERRKEIYLK